MHTNKDNTTVCLGAPRGRQRQRHRTQHAHAHALAQRQSRATSLAAAARDLRADRRRRLPQRAACPLRGVRCSDREERAAREPATLLFHGRGCVHCADCVRYAFGDCGYCACYADEEDRAWPWACVGEEEVGDAMTDDNTTLFLSWRHGGGGLDGAVLLVVWFLGIGISLEGCCCELGYIKCRRKEGYSASFLPNPSITYKINPQKRMVLPSFPRNNQAHFTTTVRHE